MWPSLRVRAVSFGAIFAAALGLALLCEGGALVAAQPPSTGLPPMCSGLAAPGRAGHFVAHGDLMRVASTVDGDDLLALVNRGPAGTLPPDYAPRDLVDVSTMRPGRWWECVPPRKQCLRREAARAYRELASAMRAAELRPLVSSAFRAYRVQCSTFLGWARRERGGFCSAATASALPGHSQHQLGTTLDLFTRDWVEGGNKFRAGFGCTAGGRWIAEHAHEHGFVLPYPLHPDYREPAHSCAARGGNEDTTDPRTGYRYEPWHLRYVGVENAAAFVAAREASGRGDSSEITLEQWLRSARGDAMQVGAPVCDGCNCERCATYASDGDSPCEQPALVLEADGAPRSAERPPRLTDARLERRDDGRLVLVAALDVAQNTLTQPPIVTEGSGALFRRGQRPAQLADRSPRAFPAIEGAWRVEVGFDDRDDWPWHAALVEPRRDGVMNGFNARTPVRPGAFTVEIPMEGVTPGTTVRVRLASPGEASEPRRLRAP